VESGDDEEDEDDVKSGGDEEDVESGGDEDEDDTI
jgi:hypothetical protein